MPTTGSPDGRAFRDLELEARVHEADPAQMGIGAQFGGKYFCHDVRVIRLPRHGASFPIGLGVSCSADRQIKGRIDKPTACGWKSWKPTRRNTCRKPRSRQAEAMAIDLDRPMDEILAPN